MAWENPVTTWGQAGKTVPGAGDFNRIEGNIQHLQDTKETPAGAQAKAEAAAGAVQAELDAHKADYTLQVPFATTAGSANAYTVSTDPALPSLVAGVAITVKFHVQNTGASTLNWNSKGAKPIKKANGSNVASGNLKANGVYTLRFDGVNFILQGSDAAGDATPADVLSGKTFSSDQDTELVGTMPNRGEIILTPGTSQKAIPAGYHNGLGYVAGDANLVADNIAGGKSIFGVTGNITNEIRVASNNIKHSSPDLVRVTSINNTVVKRFTCKYRGSYRVSAEVRCGNGSGCNYDLGGKTGKVDGEWKTINHTVERLGGRSISLYMSRGTFQSYAEARNFTVGYDIDHSPIGTKDEIVSL